MCKVTVYTISIATNHKILQLVTGIVYQLYTTVRHFYLHYRCDICKSSTITVRGFADIHAQAPHACGPQGSAAESLCSCGISDTYLSAHSP